MALQDLEDFRITVEAQEKEEKEKLELEQIRRTLQRSWERGTKKRKQS